MTTSHRPFRRYTHEKLPKRRPTPPRGFQNGPRGALCSRNWKLFQGVGSRSGKKRGGWLGPPWSRRRAGPGRLRGPPEPGGPKSRDHSPNRRSVRSAPRKARLAGCTPPETTNLMAPPGRRARGAGWGGRIRTYECRFQRPVTCHLSTPQRPESLWERGVSGKVDAGTDGPGRCCRPVWPPAAVFCDRGYRASPKDPIVKAATPGHVAAGTSHPRKT
jgi:hypothetical protein